jgi:hypothetical protein
MPRADLAATPAAAPAARPTPAFAQFPTAWRFALRNQARNRLAGLLLLVGRSDAAAARPVAAPRSG